MHMQQKNRRCIPEPPPFPTEFSYFVVPVEDRPSAKLTKYFQPTYEFIHGALMENSTNRVYIHCHAGISRSVAIAMAFLMRYQSLSFDEALHLIQHARSIAGPNPGFSHELRAYEDELQRI